MKFGNTNYENMSSASLILTHIAAAFGEKLKDS